MYKRGGIRARFLNRRKAQSSVEFILILIVVLVVFLAIIQMNSKYMNNASKQYSNSLLKGSLKELKTNIEDVYKQGEGARTSFEIILPENIQSTSIENNQVLVRLNDSGYIDDYFEIFDFKVAGSLPTSSGTHIVSLYSKDGFVVVNENKIEINPSMITVSAARNNNTDFYFEVNNKLSENIVVTVDFKGDLVLENTVNYSRYHNFNSNENRRIYANLTIPSYATENRYYGSFYIEVNSSNETFNYVIDLSVELIQGVIEVQNNAAFIYPTRWDSTLVPNQTIEQDFVICSGYPYLESYDISFSDDEVGNNWLSFSPNSTLRNLTIQVSSNECETFIIYQRANNYLEGNYLGAIRSFTPDMSEISTLVYTTIEADNIIPNISSVNFSTTYAIVDDEVCFYVNASDNSEIEEVYIQVNEPDNNEIRVNLEYESSCPNSTGLYSGSHILTKGGWYYINETIVKDISKNRATHIVNKVLFAKQVIFKATPIFATEENNPPISTWNGDPFAFENDSIYAITQDEGGYKPDYIEYRWDIFNISNDENISQLKLTYVHRDRFNDDGIFDYNNPNEDNRHMIQCYKDGIWMDLETYGLNRDHTVWNKHELLDLSRCIDEPSDLDNFRMRITFDPADNYGGSYSDVDFVELKAVITSTETPDLWELENDKPQPVDFSSGVYATSNTFGLGNGNDGWDYIDNIYTPDSTAPNSYVTHGDPSGFSDYTSIQKRLEIKVGPGSRSLYHASGAWGVEFEITDTMYDLIDKGARMFYSFSYYIEDLDGDLEEPCWVKTRFNGTYLGQDLDGHPGDEFIHYSDKTLDVYAIVDINHPDGFDEIIFRSFSEDVTDLVKHPGNYYLDFGGKIDFRESSKSTTEGCGFYFDNIRLMLVE